MTAILVACVSGPDSLDPPPGSTSLSPEFITDVFTRNWEDDGKAASSVFAFNDGDTVAVDPSVQVGETAQRSGDTMWSVGQWISTEGQWQRFVDVGDNQTAGQRNPEAVRTLGVSMAPYLGALVGDFSPESLPGFGPSNPHAPTWIDPNQNKSFEGSARVFALINTDAEAGTYFTRAAMDRMLRYQEEYAAGPNAPDAAKKFERAGALAGLIDHGLRLGLGASIADQSDVSKAACHRKEAANAQLSDRGAGGIRDSSSDAYADGVALGCSGSSELRFPNFAKVNYYVLSRMDIAPEKRDRYTEIFRGGGLRTWEDLQGSGDSERPDLTGLVNSLMGEVGAGMAFRDGYDGVTRE
ncbi:hypothetical protein [Nocardia rhizosphaerae]|uniref:Uncharacterized protein n=1 Tax=Nocardia rhizosphaerae TaxID=1691571 RepID=A0ABV8L5N0_9NOCA